MPKIATILLTLALAAGTLAAGQTAPAYVSGRVFIDANGNGVLDAGEKFKLISHNKPLDPSVFNGSPVPVDGKLLLRSDAFLYCIGS